MNYVMRCRSGYFRSSDPEGLLAWCEAHNEHIQLVWRHTTDAHLVPDYSRKLPPEPRDYVYALLMESGTPDYRSMLDHEIEVTLGDRNIDPTAEAVAAFKETAEFEEEDFDWNPSEIASYMEDDQIVIFTWSGHEGMRYCDGGGGGYNRY